MLRKEKQNGNRLSRPDKDLKTDIQKLNPTEKKILELLLEDKNALTVQEISEIELGIDAATISKCLVKLRKKKLIYAVDEQREDRIWGSRYFLRSEILKSNKMKVV
jgi:predicted transcriptional regulator